MNLTQIRNIDAVDPLSGMPRDEWVYGPPIAWIRQLFGIDVPGRPEPIPPHVAAFNAGDHLPDGRVNPVSRRSRFEIGFSDGSKSCFVAIVTGWCRDCEANEEADDRANFLINCQRAGAEAAA